MVQGPRIPTWIVMLHIPQLNVIQTVIEFLKGSGDIVGC